jgi:hypothetical protein
MNLKLVVAISLFATLPMTAAQSQKGAEADQSRCAKSRANDRWRQSQAASVLRHRQGAGPDAAGGREERHQGPSKRSARRPTHCRIKSDPITSSCWTGLILSTQIHPRARITMPCSLRLPNSANSVAVNFNFQQPRVAAVSRARVPQSLPDVQASRRNLVDPSRFPRSIRTIARQPD